MVIYHSYVCSQARNQGVSETQGPSLSEGPRELDCQALCIRVEAGPLNAKSVNMTPILLWFVIRKTNHPLVMST